jgi:hypothetical protein
MAERIDAREEKMKGELQPDGELQTYMVHEMAVASVQVQTGEDMILVESEDAIASVDDTWDDERREQASKLADRLPRAPRRVVQALENTKHGALFCLEQWRSLDVSISQKGSCTDEQRSLIYDLLGVLPCLRIDTVRVPANDNAAGLVALCRQEIRRLDNRVRLVLDARDRAAHEKARLGRPPVQPTAVQRLKSDVARARKRLVWAFDTFLLLRRGLAPALIIDPETKQPIRPAQAQTQSEAAAKAETKAKAPASPDPFPFPDDGPVADDADNAPIPVPPGLSAEEQELFLIVGETVRRQIRTGGWELPPDDVSPKA